MLQCKRTNNKIQDRNQRHLTVVTESIDDKREFFQESVSGLMNKLYGVAYQLTKDRDSAEELVAQALEQSWKSLDKLQDRNCFDGWLMRILSNQFVTSWRKGKVHEKYFEEDPYDELDESNSLYARLHQPFLLWWSSPEQMFLNNVLQEDIEKAILSIPDAYREVVVLVEVLGHNYQEVSDTLQIPVGTVRSRLNRGRKFLQDKLWSNAQEEGLLNTASSEVQK
jgi:RNA polymerase sigma-70 factor (ECF subfamily)